MIDLNNDKDNLYIDRGLIKKYGLKSAIVYAHCVSLADDNGVFEYDMELLRQLKIGKSKITNSFSQFIADGLIENIGSIDYYKIPTKK